MMFEGDLFTPKSNAKFLYFLENFEREELSEELNTKLEESGFGSTSNRYISDFTLKKVDGNIHIFFNQAHSCELENIEMISLAALTKLNRQAKRVILKNETIECLNEVYGEENPPAIYWRYLKYCFDLKTEFTGFSSFLQKVVKLPEFKKIGDLKLVEKSKIDDVIVEEAYLLEIENYFILVTKIEESREAVLVILKALNDFFNLSHFNIQENEIAGSITVGNILSTIEYPTVIINEKGVVLHHNEAFTSLSILPSLIIENEENGWIEYAEMKFKILGQKLSHRNIFYILIPQSPTEHKSLDSQSELGIISGSIAHELNNPVAGILAALTILELEQWDDENINMIKELKDSALRCKGLIDTFLGFSKYRGMGPLILPLGNVLDQTTALLRYRIVESGVSIHLDMDESCRAVEVKARVLSMVFYLIFNDLLTIFSHKLLLDPSIGKGMEVGFKVLNETLVLELKNFELDEKEQRSINQKLVSHLLEMDKININVESSHVEFDNIFSDSY